MQRAKDLRGECFQLLADAAHWNQFERMTGEPPFDIDPNGALGTTILNIDGIDVVLFKRN
jgi:hypothetical protein